MFKALAAIILTVVASDSALAAASQVYGDDACYLPCCQVVHASTERSSASALCCMIDCSEPGVTNPALASTAYVREPVQKASAPRAASRLYEVRAGKTPSNIDCRPLDSGSSSLYLQTCALLI
jgi:hypothetical protein